MFNDLIERASSLVARLEVVKKAYDNDALIKLPDSQHVAPTEVDDWFDAAAAVTTQAFGETSEQIQKWNNKRAEIKDYNRHEALAGRFNNPVGATIYEVKAMSGMLMGFQDIWNAQQKLRLRAEQVGKLETPNGENKSFNESPGPFYVRLILGLGFALIGYGILFLPQVQSWEWLRAHSNRKGLYLAEILIVTAIAYAIIDTNSTRRAIAVGTLGLSAIVAVIQIIGK